MLRYEVRQLRIESEGRYFIPLPKLSWPQLLFLKEDLRAKGYSLRSAKDLSAKKEGLGLVVSPAGLASSSSDLLDVIVPYVPRILSFAKVTLDTNPYFVVKRRLRSYEIHLFPRLESIGRWTALRHQGQSGLTPDEALVVRSILKGVEGRIECVTDYPTEGCVPTHIGRHQLYRSVIPTAEFVANLRSVSESHPHNAYLPRSSILVTKDRPAPMNADVSRELGEWCYLGLPKTSNP